jgi:20S proteasome alpha/beta subunit
MTVCIAALCGNGEKARAVVAADRMVTAGGFMEFEHPGSKIVELSPHALVMVAGATNDGMRLVNEAAASMGGNSGDIVALAEDLGQRYSDARGHRAEQTILKTRGLDFQSYYGMHNGLSQQVVMLVDDALRKFDFGVELLLAGVDDAGAHVHTNGNPGGGHQTHDSIGWTAIGSGAIHVLPSMAGFVHSPKAGYGQTLFRVYASKRRAEVAPGVGHETEVAVISRDGTKRLSNTELQELDSIYESFVSMTDTELQKQMDEFDPEGESNEAD